MSVRHPIHHLYTLYRVGLLSLIWTLGSLIALAQLPSSSPMASGLWGKIAVERSGLYVLTEANVRSLGFSSLAQVRLWGYGGGLLPEQISLLSGHKLREIPTYLVGDRLYFYAEGPTRWLYDAEHSWFYHETNHYTREGYYLLSQGDSPLRMGHIEGKPLGDMSPQARALAETYTDVLLHEQELSAPAQSGRKLYGESLQLTTSLSHTHHLPETREVTMRLAYMAYPTSEDARLSVRLNGEPYTQVEVPLADMNRLISSSGYKVYGLDREHTEHTPYRPTSDDLRLSLEASTRGITSRLDYYELNLKRKLRYRGGQLSFSRAHPRGSQPKVTPYLIEGAQGLMLLGVNSSSEAYIVQEAITSSSLALELPALDAAGVAPARYLALRLSDAYSPRLVGRLPNQNLLGITETPDLLIITTEALRAESTRLAEHYRRQGQSVVVTTQTEVFNEFNGGTPDATAYRLVARHLYDLYPGADCPMQILLVGDAAHDNRKLTALWQAPEAQRTEFLLSYQSVNSLDLTSYTSDDYFGVLADEKPRRAPRPWESLYPQLAELAMDVGVGRLPVRSPHQARAVIDKIIGYELGGDHGAWKMRAAFVADNGDGNSHTRQSIEISDDLERQMPALQLRKIYMAAYPRVNVGGRTSVPGAHKALMEALEEGVLIANYNGHGSPHTWADEQVLTISDIQNFTHRHLPLWITATCDFAGFDAFSTSAGEEVLLHPTSGGVALLSTTRVVWDIPNQMLNTAILKELFTPRADGSYRPLGQIVRDAKNSLRHKSTPENRLNFVLLGSPLTRIQMPPTLAKVEKLSGQQVEEHKPIALYALEQVQLEGYIQTPQGDIDGDFSGQVELWVYDGEEELETIDNFNRRGSDTPPVRYQDYRNIIYTGSAAVEGGRYQLRFSIPKDVAYSGRNGRISLYARDAVRNREVVGLSQAIVIRTGRPRQLVEDRDAPEILSLSLSGQAVDRHPVVSTSTLLEATLQDASAINLSTAGLGHRIRLTLDGQADRSYDLNRYYTASLTASGLGQIRFVLEGLSPGKHTAQLEVWDVYNNATSRIFSFAVQPGLMPKIESLALIGVEGSRLPSLWLKHSQAGMTLMAKVSVYDLSGRQLWQSAPQRLSGSNSGSDYRIDLSRLESGTLEALPPGAYLLRLGLSSESGAESSSSIKWLKGW